MRHLLPLFFALSMPLVAIAQSDVNDLKEQASRGVRAAQGKLGWRYFLGEGVPKDDKRALELLQAAVAQGDPLAMTRLAHFYYWGVGVPVDHSKTADLNERAASANCTRADDESCSAIVRGKVNLAMMLLSGDGRPTDPKRAVRLLKDALASEYEFLDAKMTLAGLAINGTGMPPDPKLAIRLFTELATAGNADAARDLGTIYYRGLAGVPVDLGEAKRWYGKAAAKHAVARTALDEIQARERDPLGAAAQSQQQLLQTQRDNKAVEEAIRATRRKLAERSADHARRLYFAAKSAGVRMVPVASALAEANAGRRRTGVWELKVDEQLDGPYLVSVLDFLERDIMFAIEGRGAYSVRGYLRDPQFEKSGKFAADCRYQISFGQQSKTYPCSPFLSGELDVQVERDLKEMLAADIKR